MNNIQFDYYPANITHCSPMGKVSIDRFFNSIKNPKEDTKQIFEQIKLADEAGDMKLKSDLKTKLYYFTPCVNIIGWRNYKNIQRWTGLLMLDFDKLTTEYAIEFKEYLFNEFDCIIAMWLSASKHGCRGFVSIPICNSVDEFKHYFNAVERKFNIFKGFDVAPKNCVLPLFMSYDENILIRENYSTWTEKFIPVERPVVKQYIITDKSTAIERIMVSAINKIISVGHPQLRAAAFALGGYCGAGHIDEGSAFALICNLIDSNAYLSQKKEIYKKTAKTMIQKGKLKELHIL